MWSYYFPQLLDSLPLFLRGLGMTVLVSGLGILAGTLIGLGMGIGRVSQSRLLRGLIGVWVDVIRGTPFLVQIFILFFILPELGIRLEAFPAAVIALTNLAACFICEIVAAGIAAVPPGQTEAAAATGLSRAQQLRYVLLPQALRLILPALVGTYVLLIKDSSVVSVIGVVDVTRVGWLTVQRLPEGLMVFGLVGILYCAICYPLIWLSNRLEKGLKGVAAPSFFG